MQEPSPGKLLLVEDNPDDEALMLRAIKKSNIKEEVVVVRDGAEAVQYLLEQGPDGEERAEWLPRVVFLDLKLPRLDGLEVLQRIRANASTRLLPVVILTTSGQEEDLLRSYVLGASSFVRKPISYSELIKVASHLVTYWLTINQVPFASAYLTPPRQRQFFGCRQACCPNRAIMDKRLQVLLIEDLEDDAELVIHALRRGGFQFDHQRITTDLDLQRALRASVGPGAMRL